MMSLLVLSGRNPLKTSKLIIFCGGGENEMALLIWVSVYFLLRGDNGSGGHSGDQPMPVAFRVMIRSIDGKPVFLGYLLLDLAMEIMALEVVVCKDKSAVRAHLGVSFF